MQQIIGNNAQIVNMWNTFVGMIWNKRRILNRQRKNILGSCFMKSKFDDWIKKVKIIIDSREKNIKHIIDVFDRMDIKYKIQKLDIGDYCFCYDDEIFKCIVERKNSLDELSQNFSINRDRFKREFEKLTEDSFCHLLIEQNTLNDLICGNYRSQINRNSFLASLLSFEYRYNIRTHFVEKKYTAFYITKLFFYYYMSKINHLTPC